MGGGGTVDTTRKCCPYCDTVHPPRPAPHHTNPCPLIEYGAVRR